MNIYDVLRPSNDNTIIAKNSFVQGGSELGITVFVNDESSPLMGLSVPIAYTTLYGFSGQYKEISLFDAKINYTFPKTKYLTVGLGYTAGRNLDTFEQQKVYKASFGVKY